METYLIGRGHVARGTRGLSSQMDIVCLVDCGIARRPRCCRDEKTRVTIWGGRTTRWAGARAAKLSARGFRGFPVCARPVNSTVRPHRYFENAQNGNLFNRARSRRGDNARLFVANDIRSVGGLGHRETAALLWRRKNPRYNLGRPNKSLDASRTSGLVSDNLRVT